MNHQISNMRCIAALFVIILHTAGVDFYLFSSWWWINNLLDSFTRCCVPLFLMISGALLINKQENTFSFIKKRCLRIIPVLLFWGGLYQLKSQVKHLHSLQYIEFNFLIKSPSVHLWYLYAVLGLYLIIPILSKFYTNVSKKEVLFYLVIWILVLEINQFNQVNILDLYYLKSFVSYAGYFLLGAFLYDVQKQYMLYTKYLDFAGYIIISLIICFLTYRVSYKLGAPIETYYKYNTPLVIIQSLFIFSYILKINLNSKIMDIISFNSLGIYCVHVLILSTTYSVIKNLISFYPVFLFAEMLITIFVSLLIIIIMRRVRIFNRVI